MILKNLPTPTLYETLYYRLVYNNVTIIAILMSTNVYIFLIIIFNVLIEAKHGRKENQSRK